MKNYLVIAFFIIFCFACKTDIFQKQTNSEPPTKSKDTSTVVNKISPTENRPANSAPKTENTLVSLKKMKDKTASDIKLWSKPEVSQRLEKLMGKDYQTMKKFWGVETPMEVEGDILRLTGCEAHNCGSNQYIIFIDTANDNINVHHILEQSLKSYNEKGEIKLPKKFAEEFQMDTFDVKK